MLAPAGARFTTADGTALRVTWTLPGDRRDATDTLRPTLVTRSGRTVVAGLHEAERSPIWALSPSLLTASEAGTLISSGLDEDEREAWAARLDRAAAEVAAADILVEPVAWDGGLVVQIPAKATDFATITGVDGADSGAVAECGTGTPRITVNPLLFGAEEYEVSATLVHEAVHVATDSPCPSADPPYAWAVEGLAESVAARVHPEIAQLGREAVRAYLAEHGVPDDLPEPVTDVTQYALARVAAEQVRTHLDRDAAADFFDRAIRRSAAVTDEERADVREWYLAELRRIAASA